MIHIVIIHIILIFSINSSINALKSHFHRIKPLKSSLSSQSTPSSSIWTFVDDVYLITTSQSSTSQRLEKTKEQLEKINLWPQVNIRTFKTDDEDRVRGCYTSHISILNEIQKKYKNKENYRVLVLEDNLELTLSGSSSDLIETISKFFDDSCKGYFLL